jgi:hypothetical protein
MFNWLGRLLDPPDEVHRNKLIQSGAIPRPPALADQVVPVVGVGCVVPLAVLAPVVWAVSRRL